MPNIGPVEVVVVAIIALVIFGPKRLPELGRSMGRGIREFKSTVSGKEETNTAAPPGIERGTPSPEVVDGEVVTQDPG